MHPTLQPEVVDTGESAGLHRDNNDIEDDLRAAIQAVSGHSVWDKALGEHGCVTIEDAGPWTAGPGRIILAKATPKRGHGRVLKVAAIRLSSKLHHGAYPAAVAIAVRAALLGSADNGHWHEVIPERQQG